MTWCCPKATCDNPDEKKYTASLLFVIIRVQG
jgi:hypothetical protein